MTANKFTFTILFKIIHLLKLKIFILKIKLANIYNLFGYAPWHHKPS